MENTKYLTVAQVCDRLQLHRNTVEGMLRDGKLPGRKFGRQWRIPLTALDSLGSCKAVESGQVTPAP